MTLTSFFVRRALVASAAVLILGAAACVAPVDMDVDVGRRVTIQYKDSAESARPQQIAEAVRGLAGNTKEMQIRALKQGNDVVIRLDIWSDSLPDGPLADSLRASVPALATADIQEQPLTAKVHGTLGAKLGHDLLDLDVLDTEDVETARQKLMEQLAANGVEGKVDVQVEGDGKQRKVKIRVEQEECDPESAAFPEPPARVSP